MKQRLVLLGLCCSVSFFSCEEPPVDEPTASYEEGVFVVNEGIFGQTSGTISYYNRNTQAVEQKIFNKANQRDLGDVVQSLYFHNEKAYIVVNNSNKIEVADGGTFAELAQINNLRLPRYFMPISNSKAYVSEWGADGLTGTIAVLDLDNNTVSQRIAVGAGPEGLLIKFDKLYVAHTGGYGNNNKITVINTITDQIETTINVYDKPSVCVADLDANLWVACSGKTEYTTWPNIDTANSTASALLKISPSSYAVLDTISFGKANAIGNLTVNSNNKNELYYTRKGKVWKYDITTGLETEIFEGSFYGLGFDPNNNYIYAATSSGVNAAYVKRYQTNGTLIDSFQVGVFANGLVFK